MGTRLNLLIVEDAPDDAELIVAQLRRNGYDPDWRRVDTEAEFLAALAAGPDIVLSDYSMPRFSGLRAAQLTRASGRNIPFILVSGTVGEDAAVEAMKHGAFDYLLKDRIARLGAAVERALEQKRLRDAQQAAEAELRWKTTVLEAQMESSPDGILVVDVQGRRIFQNQRLAQMWQLPPVDEADKTSLPDLIFNPGLVKNPGPFVDRVAYLNAHPGETGHEVVELADGTVLDRYSAPVRDKAGKGYGRIWCFRDITERRKLEAQFRQAQKMESIGLLAGGIAHDFNNILSAVLGNLYLAKLDAAKHPEITEHLDNIFHAARRATDLVNQILTFSRQNKPERAPIKLNGVVLEALKLLRASVPATIQIQTDLVSTPLVLANSTAVHQVLMNLGTNAWHAMRDQPGVLTVALREVELDAEFVRAHAGTRPGCYVRLSVSDTGHGMDAATLERIFDPFFTTKAVGEGTGLGLAVVLGIMQSHAGTITVLSEPGKGATFHLYFPVHELKAPPPEPVAAPVPPGHGEHILLVDDETSLASVGKKILERLGYTVTAKTTALEAVAAVRDQPEKFQLVITDLTMPEMDGLILCNQLLQIRPDLPIILSTGYTGVMTRAMLREHGFRDLLVKPATIRVLGETVQRVLYPPAA